MFSRIYQETEMKDYMKVQLFSLFTKDFIYSVDAALRLQLARSINILGFKSAVLVKANIL